MKRYATLLIDPPWTFHLWSEKNTQRPMPYSTMSHNDLCCLPMQNIMAGDCAVFLWATWATLIEAIQVADAWGLEYKTCAFNWVKLNKQQADTPFMGMGYWTRANSEPCLLFTRGKPKRRSKGVPQMLIDWQGGMFDTLDTETLATRIGAHSEKPNAIYERIEALVGGDYCEVFARRRRAGWDAIGNEIDGRDIRDVLAAPLFAAE